MRILTLIGLLAVAGCAARPGAGEHACTEIGTPVGIAVDVAAPFAATVATATLTACWPGMCQTEDVQLFASGTVGGSGCAGGVCSAESRPTGGKHGFADVPGIPAAKVQVSVAFTPSAGAGAPDDVMLDVTPKLAYPNGPDCGSGGPQAGVLVDGEGRAAERP
jgi:hypothetical protein